MLARRPKREPIDDLRTLATSSHVIWSQSLHSGAPAHLGSDCGAGQPSSGWNSLRPERMRRPSRQGRILPPDFL
jgi:hypothetical protein